MVLSLILLMFALVFFVIAALAPAEPWRWRLLCFGLACIAGAGILAGILPPPVHLPGR